MSFFDKFLDVMRLNADDDEFYNEDYEYDEDEELEEEREKKYSSRKERTKPQREEKKERVSSYEGQEKSTRQVSKITPISKSKKQAQPSGMEVCVIKPNSIEDELEIVETLLNSRTVVINMEGLSVDIAQRIIDFTSGATFAMHGNLQKISNYIFLATPSGVDISGDIQNLMEAFDIPGFKM
ncbi:MAG: cell division protein SepF [Muribaculaceae bacterium]|nr:cell division protein SepF [Roseburia sp.]MCM1430938.1 cell division protein SepF [Muribaculaceae bacterium]MCM1493886.1 cell division protein SepF [Muribaculaceae bacterium]